MNIDSLINKIENIFLELGFKVEFVGKRKHRYMRYKNCYCRVTYLKSLSAFVIESANNFEDAENARLEDGELYFLKDSHSVILNQLREDIKSYYVD